MDDKTEQDLTGTLRFAAKSAMYKTAMIAPSCLIAAADTIDNLRAQLAEAQRELIAKEAEHAAMELERNNAQRQHRMQCVINKIDSQRILELTAQLAEAQGALEGAQRLFKEALPKLGSLFLGRQRNSTVE